MYFFVFVAGVIAMYFAAATWERPRPAGVLALILWAAYAVYESQVANGTLCDPYCNIRVDLVLFFPLLGVATYLALQKEPRTGSAAALAIVCLIMIAWLGSAFGSLAVTAGALVAALILATIAIKWKMSKRT